MSKLIKLKCALCPKGRGESIVPSHEAKFRVDIHKRFVCWQHCKQIRWESKCCKSCSDRVLCSGKAKDKFKKDLEKIVGI